MTALDNHHTDKELAKELKKKTGFGCERTLRKWREQRIGPPWVKFGKAIQNSSKATSRWRRQPEMRPAPRKRPRRAVSFQPALLL
jgi:hypothetical protein